MRRVPVRGCELAYELSGEGPDVIWGHGLTSSMASEDARGWIDWDRIRTTRRVLRYDARGHGESASTADPDDYSWANLARDQLALADALGVGRYVAAGASMGCATALHAAAQAPDRIEALILVVPPTAWATRAAQVGTYRAMADLIEAGDHATLLRGASANPPPDPLVDDPALQTEFAELLVNTDPVRLGRVFRGAGTADLPDPTQVAAIDIPTLILGWTGDAGHPVQTAARLQELIPNAELALATTPAGVAAWTDRMMAFLRDRR
jgi:pimeloyl-ACP methyl ester carboxylesterase